MQLVKLRASQINGCLFCLDMHTKEALIHGERPLRIYHLAAWHESPLFDEKERAALRWTEVVTKVASGGVSDADYAKVREVYSEKEVSDLTFAIAAINAWNRLGVAFNATPGTLDKVMGLDKAGLK
jgi:AhpD family alkylhydroperoxidase